MSLFLKVWSEAFSGDWQTVSACYGITHANFMSIECEADTVIALKDVRAMVKLSSTECPQAETAIEKAAEYCCRRQDEDCGATYTGVVASQYYTLCHGRSRCSMLQPTWVDTEIDTKCDTTIYLERTNYMEMQYQCISTQSGASPCASVSVTDTSVILWNDDYPSRMRPEQNRCSCSVEASCDTSIQITTLDIHFTDDGGVCKQGIVITENEQTVQIGCETNNNYQKSTIYTSSSQFLILEVLNEFSTYGGQFWFEITGTSANANLTLSCGQLVQSEQRTERRDCTETETSTTASTTSASISSPATSWQSSTTDTVNDTSTSYSTTAGPTANITIAPAEQLNDTLDDDSLNGTNPVNDSSAEDDFEKGENETATDDGTTDNSTMPFNDTTHGNESRSTTDVLTTVNPDLDYNTSLISSIVSTTSTEGYNSSTTSINTENTTVLITGNRTEADNDTGSGEDSHSSTKGTTTLVTTHGFSGGRTDTEADDTGDGQDEGVSQSGGGAREGSNTTSSAAESGDGMMMMIIIAAVIAALLLILFILLWFNRRKIKELLCGEKAKSQIDPEDYRTESPPKYDTMPDYLFSSGDSPVISSTPAGSTQLHFRKQPEIDVFKNGIVWRGQQLQPILSKIPTEKRLPPVDTSLLSKSKKTRKTQKLGFLNMILVENQKNPLPRLYPDHIEGAIKESYGASSHATTDSEVIEKGRQNVNRKSKLRRKKRRLMERIHGHPTAIDLNPY